MTDETVTITMDAGMLHYVLTALKDQHFSEAMHARLTEPKIIAERAGYNAKFLLTTYDDILKQVKEQTQVIGGFGDDSSEIT